MSPIGRLFLTVVEFDRVGLIMNASTKALDKMSGGSRWYCERLLAMSHPTFWELYV